jgi:hypothetical protein
MLVLGVLASAGATAQDKTDRWHEQLGKRVTLTGEAHNAKMGALLEGKDFMIWVDLPGEAWPNGMYHGNDEGDPVVVTGTVVQRSDLPVFIAEPGEMDKAGIPMPPGTDLEEARKRYILEDVTWSPAIQQR